VEQSSSKTWQMATLVLPVILTGWLTFTSSRSEDKIKQEIDAKNQLLTAQLNLATELFKRRFDAYEALYGALINLNEKLLLQQANSAAASRADSNFDKRLAVSNRQTADLLSELDQLNKKNALHLSEGVANGMTNAWQSGVQGDTKALAQKIDQVEQLMKKRDRGRDGEENDWPRKGRTEQESMTESAVRRVTALKTNRMGGSRGSKKEIHAVG